MSQTEGPLVLALGKEGRNGMKFLHAGYAINAYKGNP
jgi:hypothetical protein